MGRVHQAMCGWSALAALLGVGCFSPPPESVARLAQEKRDGEVLMKSADDLEDRLLGAQANLELWQELERRHKNVSAVVVQNHSEHFDEMVRLLDLQQEKARKLHHGRSVASAEGGLSGAIAARRIRHPKED